MVCSPCGGNRSGNADYAIRFRETDQSQGFARSPLQHTQPLSLTGAVSTFATADLSGPPFSLPRPGFPASAVFDLGTESLMSLLGRRCARFGSGTG